MSAVCLDAVTDDVQLWATHSAEYVQPGFALSEIEEPRAHEWVQFAIFAGYAAALAFSYYCRRTGGWPSISFGWSGFKVACSR